MIERDRAVGRLGTAKRRARALLAVRLMRGPDRARSLVLAAILPVMACASPEVEAEGSSTSAIATDRMGSGEQGQPRKRIDPGKRIDQLQVTHYTLPSEEDFEDEDDFLCSGRGVAMQGTGVRKDGTLVRYEGGGGGWKANYSSLEDCASAVFGPVDGVLGSSGRTLTEHYSIAVDERVIPMGSYVWLEATSRWYRADDTGGAIKGKHIDVFVGAQKAALPPASAAFVTMTPHAPTDPAPEPASTPADVFEPPIEVASR